jgi:hypothetical protein
MAMQSVETNGTAATFGAVQKAAALHLMRYTA